jgi:hypothetical protein
MNLNLILVRQLKPTQSLFLFSGPAPRSLGHNPQAIFLVASVLRTGTYMFRAQLTNHICACIINYNSCISHEHRSPFSPPSPCEEIASINSNSVFPASLEWTAWHSTLHHTIHNYSAFSPRSAGWWLVLICCEKKILLAGWWLLAGAKLVWEKSTAGWLGASQPNKAFTSIGNWTVAKELSVHRKWGVRQCAPCSSQCAL